MIEITELTHADEEVFGQIRELHEQLVLSNRTTSLEDVLAAIEDVHTTILVLKEGERIVGMGALVVFHLITGNRGRLEDIVVSERYRGQGLGKRITSELVERARKKGVQSLELSSRPTRQAASTLYEKLGFEPKETRVYFLNL